MSPAFFLLHLPGFAVATVFAVFKRICCIQTNTSFNISRVHDKERASSATEEPVSIFIPFGFFVLRTPLLPFDELVQWGQGLQAPTALLSNTAALKAALEADRHTLRERLRSIAQRPEVHEALFLASPSLEQSLARWREEPESEKGQKAERALVRYFIRMAARSTPFGLFAGCSVGTIGAQTVLSLASQSQYQRHARLDMHFVCMLVETLTRDPAIRHTLTYQANSSLYKAGGRLRYAELQLSNKGSEHPVVDIEPTEPLEATLRRAHNDAHAEALAAALVEDDPEVSLEEAQGYIEQLIESQILVPTLLPSITGPDPMVAMLARLKAHAAPEGVVTQLDEVVTQLCELNQKSLGVPTQMYRSLTQKLEKISPKLEPEYLFQVDMVKPLTGQATLGAQTTQDMLKGVQALHCLAPPRTKNEITSFYEAFLKRYETREVPLVEALDEDVGIGFQAADTAIGDASPLLEDLKLPGPPTERTGVWNGRDHFLLKKLLHAIQHKEQEISLDLKELQSLQGPSCLPLPDSFVVLASLTTMPKDNERHNASSRTDLNTHSLRPVIWSVIGPSGLQFLGRFCHADPTLLQWVERQARAEDALAGDEMLLADIVHLPLGRTANVMLRPSLRSYEIVYHGLSGAPPEKQLAIDDLTLSAREGRMVLRSARYQKEIRVRMTSAHNYVGSGNLPLYRFLATLQNQDNASWLSWTWGPLSACPFLPRVVVGATVLARAQWNVSPADVDAICKTQGVERYQAMQALRARVGLPRFIAISDPEAHDNSLTIDLDNTLSVDAFAHAAKKDLKEGNITLHELLSGIDELVVKGPEGNFQHELIVPFVRKNVETQPPCIRLNGNSEPVVRSFPPGSEWLYIKLFMGTSNADHIVRQALGPLTHQVLASEAADQWFFLRYGDPEWHLRIRFHGDPARLCAEVLPAVYKATEPFRESGSLWRIQLDTYEREVERYGGAYGIALAERIFSIDSQAVFALLQLLEEDAEGQACWQLALYGIDRLLNDLGLSLDSKQELIKQVRMSFGKEFHVTSDSKHQLGNKFRKHRSTIEALLSKTPNPQSEAVSKGLSVLHLRSEQLAPVTAQLKVHEDRLTVPIQGLAGSFIHMYTNRLLSTGARAQELVLYDILDRWYESQRSRQH